MMPSDMRARVLRSTLDTVSGEIHGAGLDPALAARLDFIVAEARRHALELEGTLRPVPVPQPAPRPSRRFVGHAEAGSNVITLRAS